MSILNNEGHDPKGLGNQGTGRKPCKLELTAAEVDEMFGKPLREKLRAAGFKVREEGESTSRFAILNLPVDTGNVTGDIVFTNTGHVLIIEQF